MNVQAGQAVVAVQDESSWEIRVDVPDAIVRQHKNTDGVVLEAVLPDYPDSRFPLTFKGFEREADVETRTFGMLLTLDPKDLGDNMVLPGMSVEVLARRDRPASQKSYNIPSTALSSDSTGATYLWIVDVEKKTVSKRQIDKVELSDKGFEISGTTEIKSNTLTDETIIVTAGTSFLADGQRIALPEEGAVK